MIFPTLAAENLEGRRLTLPADLEGAYNLIMITFQQRQQVEVESWLPLLHRLSAQYETLRYYLLPTVQVLPDCQHEFLDVGARFHLNGRRGRENTLRLYVDLNDFNRALDIPTVSQMYTFLLDQSGKVLWRANGGAYNPDCAPDLLVLLNHLYPSRAKRRIWTAPELYAQTN